MLPVQKRMNFFDPQKENKKFLPKYYARVDAYVSNPIDGGIDEMLVFFKSLIIIQ